MLTKYESETIMNYNDGEDISTVFTCNKALIRKMDNYCKKYPDLYHVKNQDEESKTYYIPKKYISIRQPKILSEEQKAAMSERGKQLMAKLRENAG